jgi:hypothetical protein
MTGKSVAFATGSGRCGTNFLAKLFELERGVASHHERHPLNDTFHRYCMWYGIPVDDAGFLHSKKKGLEEDFAHFWTDVSFESSAYLALSLETLRSAFNPKFIMLVRRPDKVVLSYLKKGWYQDPIYIDNPDLPPTGQPCREFHHFLGRTVPRGSEYHRWCELSRVGKIAWYWNLINREILRQITAMPAEIVRLQKLEELDHDAYRELAEFMGVRKPRINPKEFSKLADSRPNAFAKPMTVRSWSAREREEFLAEVAEMAGVLGYDLTSTQW